MNDEMFDKPKCCISIDATCANKMTYYDVDLMEDVEYCANQMTCEDFDPIWTDEDSENALIKYMEEQGNHTKEELEEMFKKDSEYKEEPDEFEGLEDGQ